MESCVFISYSSFDKTIADAICDTLERRQIRCWIAPRDVTPGMVYGECLAEAIQRSAILLLVLSARSNQSPHVMREVEIAVSHRKAILPFRIENIFPSKSLEYFLRSVQWLDAMPPLQHEHLQRLTDAVTLLLQRPDCSSSAPAESPAQPPVPTLLKQRVRVRVWAAALVPLLLGGVATYYLYTPRPPSASPSPNGPNSPLQPPTSSSVDAVNQTQSTKKTNIVIRNHQETLEKQEMLLQLGDLFIMWTISGLLRDDAEKDRYALSAFDSLLVAGGDKEPNKSMVNWIAAAKQRASEATGSPKTNFNYLEFDTSGNFEKLELEESFFRLWKAASEAREASNMAKVRLALIAAVGQERQRQLIGDWNSRLK